MRAYDAAIIRDGILTARKSLAREDDAVAAAFHRARDERLWFRAYWRTLQHRRVAAEAHRMRLNVRNDVARHIRDRGGW